MQYGKIQPLGSLNFPGFQKILNFTATGSESSVSVAVNGDVDKEYWFIAFNRDTSNAWRIRLNGASTGYGFQYIDNSFGDIVAGQNTNTSSIAKAQTYGMTAGSILTPIGLQKTAFSTPISYSFGTTIGSMNCWAGVFDSVSNVTSISAVPDSGNIYVGSRFIIFARRSN